MIYGYARVSTNGQARAGNSLEAQTEVLRGHGVDKIYIDAFTGKKKHRPQLDELLRVIKSGDTLIVTKLDRIARTAKAGAELIDELFAKGVVVHVANMGRMDNTTVGKLLRQILFAFAEYELDMILERTSEGKEIARLNPEWREGRPKIEVVGFEDVCVNQERGNITVKAASASLGVSVSTYRRMKLRSNV